jgi:hypothetical protein
MEHNAPDLNPPPTSRPAPGWTVGRVIGFVFGLLSLVGFGVCGLCGVSISLEGRHVNTEILTLTALGLAAASLSFLLLRWIWRRVKGVRVQP